MRKPFGAVTNNLIWLTDGAVWAAWRLEATGTALGSLTARTQAFQQVSYAMAQMTDDFLLLSVAGARPLVDVIDAGRKLSDAETWQRYCDDLAEARGDEMHPERTYWLLARVAIPSASGAFTGAWRSLTSSLQLPPPPPNRKRIDTMAQRAREIELRWSSLDPQQATAAEIGWIYASRLRLGLIPPVRPISSSESLQGPHIAQIANVAIEPSKPKDFHIAVSTLDGTAYQRHLALSTMPSDDFDEVDGGRWFALLDTSPVMADWTFSARVVSRKVATDKAKEKHEGILRELEEEYGGEDSGPPPAVDAALSDLEEYRALLAANKVPEIQGAMWVSIGRQSLTELDEATEEIRQVLGTQIVLDAPAGGQEALLREALPGCGSLRSMASLESYRHYNVPAAFAAGAPIAVGSLGAPAGILIGEHASSGLWESVFVDPSAPTRDRLSARSGSIAIVGTLGAGKSWLMKTLVEGVVKMGGQVLVKDSDGEPDGSVLGEWVRFANALEGIKTQVIGPSTTLSLDPYKLIPNAEEAGRAAAGLLATLVGAGPLTPEGAAILEACEKVAGDWNPSLRRVLDTLEEMNDPDALAARGRLRAFARTGVFFDPGRIAPDLDADLIVWWAPKLDLPSYEQIVSPDLAKMIPAPQVLNLGITYAIAAASRSVLYRDRSRFSMFASSDAHSFLGPPAGRELITDIALKGRKNNAALLLDSQDVEHFPDSVIQHIGIRYGGAQELKRGAAMSRWLGVEDDDIGTAFEQRELPSGTFLMRDGRGRVGIIKTTTPSDPRLAEAFDTTPI